MRSRQLTLYRSSADITLLVAEPESDRRRDPPSFLGGRSRGGVVGFRHFTGPTRREAFPASRGRWQAAGLTRERSRSRRPESEPGPVRDRWVEPSHSGEGIRHECRDVSPGRVARPTAERARGLLSPLPLPSPPRRASVRSLWPRSPVASRDFRSPSSTQALRHCRASAFAKMAGPLSPLPRASGARTSLVAGLPSWGSYWLRATDRLPGCWRPARGSSHSWSASGHR